MPGGRINFSLRLALARKMSYCLNYYKACLRILPESQKYCDVENAKAKTKEKKRKKGTKEQNPRQLLNIRVQSILYEK